MGSSLQAYLQKVQKQIHQIRILRVHFYAFRAAVLLLIAKLLSIQKNPKMQLGEYSVFLKDSWEQHVLWKLILQGMGLIHSSSVN